MKLLDDMALFVEVANVMSFRQASDITGVPSSTLSRRISALEKNIGLRLFHRTTRKIELTEAGRLYYERCHRIVEEAKLAHAHLSEIADHPKGIVRVSAPVDFAVNYIAPLLPDFIQRYPDIQLEFDLTSRRVDMTSERFDVAIRAGESDNSNLIARKLAHFRHYVYAAPSYLTRHTPPKTPDELSQHACFSILKTATWKLYCGDEMVSIKVNNPVFVNSMGMLKHLAILGMGMVLVPHDMVNDEVKQGRLQRVLTDWQSAVVPIYAITETRLLPVKTRCFIDFLQQKLADKMR